jgi:cyanophycinase
MKHPPIYVCLCLLAWSLLAHAQDPAVPLSPAGAPGALVIHPGVTAPEAILKLFNQRAGTAGFIVGPAEAAKAVKSQFEKRDAKTQAPALAEEKDLVRLAAAKTTLGLWLALPAGTALTPAITAAVTEVRARGGIVVTALPLTGFPVQLKNATLTIIGRAVRVEGDGEAIFTFPATGLRRKKELRLKAGETQDFNELMRVQAGRLGSDFPPRIVSSPVVPKGALVIVGGGGLPKEIATRFLELGGGEKGEFVVLPTSMPDPVNMQAEGVFLQRLGAKNLTLLPGRERADVEKPENLAVLKKATGIWFGGGRQWRFLDAYEGTAALPLFHEVLKRGGVIGGSSAGATIQGEYLVRGAPAGPHIMMCEGYERGFRFLPGTAIDQHFSARNRFKDMTAFMETYPQYLGIGIDEATALIVQGSTAAILGKGKVHFYDRQKTVPAQGPDYDAYPAGTKYDLKERKVIK